MAATRKKTASGSQTTNTNIEVTGKSIESTYF